MLIPFALEQIEITSWVCLDLILVMVVFVVVAAVAFVERIEERFVLEWYWYCQPLHSLPLQLSVALE